MIAHLDGRRQQNGVRCLVLLDKDMAGNGPQTLKRGSHSIRLRISHICPQLRGLCSSSMPQFFVHSPQSARCTGRPDTLGNPSAPAGTGHSDDQRLQGGNRTVRCSGHRSCVGTLQHCTGMVCIQLARSHRFLGRIGRTSDQSHWACTGTVRRWGCIQSSRSPEGHTDKSVHHHAE